MKPLSWIRDKDIWVGEFFFIEKFGPIELVKMQYHLNAKWIYATEFVFKRWWFGFKNDYPRIRFGRL